MTLTTSQTRHPHARAAAVLRRLLPEVEAHGLADGFDRIRWASPPFAVLLRSWSPLHRVEVTFGQLVLRAEWIEGGELRVHYFAHNGWDAVLLEGVG